MRSWSDEKSFNDRSNFSIKASWSFDQENIKRAVEQIKAAAWRYLLDVGHFTRTHTMKKGKILSLFAKAVAYVDKKKAGKSAQFGRVFQLGRLKGNFLFVLRSTSVLMSDKFSLRPLLEEHQKLFGKGALHSIATDKGYWVAAWKGRVV